MSDRPAISVKVVNPPPPPEPNVVIEMTMKDALRLRVLIGGLVGMDFRLDRYGDDFLSRFKLPLTLATSGEKGAYSMRIPFTGSLTCDQDDIEFTR